MRLLYEAFDGNLAVIELKLEQHQLQTSDDEVATPARLTLQEMLLKKLRHLGTCSNAYFTPGL